MSSVVETLRSTAEELERIEQAIADRIKFNPKLLPDTQSLSSGSVLNGKRKRPVRDTLIQQHEISRLLDRYQQQCLYLKTSLETDINSINQDERTTHPAVQRKSELDALRKLPGNASAEVFTRFYNQISGIREFYEKYPNDEADDKAAQFKMRRVVISDYLDRTGQLPEGAESLSSSDKLLSAFAADFNVDTLFSGEEYFGRFLDLVSFHDDFLNVKSIQYHVSYVQYLDIFYTFDMKNIYTSQRLNDNSYFEYIAKLDDYLSRFLKKIRVLGQPEAGLAKIDQDFEQQYEENKISWLEDINGSSNSGNPLFCKPCGKLFTTEGVFKGHLNGKQHKRNAASAGDDTTFLNGSESSSYGTLKFKTLVFHEFRVKEISLLLQKLIGETKANVERRQALTDRERQLEIETLEKEVYGDGNDVELDGTSDNDRDSDEDSNDGAIYNPLKLPIGWDGKPIPFWLWKLHGMGIEYVCEICGNYSYMGRREFEKHFLEARHSHGLKCLAIEPSPLFKGITSISDAQALWNKVKKGSRQQDSRREHTIEMEDDEGNIMSEKVYNDLKKQGLI